MQTVLKRFSQQQNAQMKEPQQIRRKQQRNDPLEHNTLVERLMQMVAEKEAQIKELQEIQQPLNKVK